MAFVQVNIGRLVIFLFLLPVAIQQGNLDTLNFDRSREKRVSISVKNHVGKNFKSSIKGKLFAAIGNRTYDLRSNFATSKLTLVGSH